MSVNLVEVAIVDAAGELAEQLRELRELLIARVGLQVGLSDETARELTDALIERNNLDRAALKLSEARS